MALTELEQQRLETATRVLHETSHLIVRGHACDRCRARARAVARVLWGTTDLEKSPPAA